MNILYIYRLFQDSSERFSKKLEAQSYGLLVVGMVWERGLWFCLEFDFFTSNV